MSEKPFDPTPRETTITGNLTPFVKGRPVFINMDSHPDYTWIGVYTTKEKLEASMREMRITEYTIKKIDDGAEFLDSVIPQVRVMQDPWRTERGTVRWVEITQLK